MEKKRTAPVVREIMDALIRLMTEKPYIEITVTDVVREAGVARASFYRHFGSIQDVLEKIIEELAENFALIYPASARHPEDGNWSEFLFNHFNNFFTKGHGVGPRDILTENLPIIFSNLDKHMEVSVHDIEGGSLKEKYAFAGKIGLLNNITQKWLETGAVETPEEMRDYVMSFITLF